MIETLPSPRPAWLSLVALAGLGLAACGDDDSSSSDAETLSDDAVVEYHFGDSSVEPQYHRSYTLTIRPDEVDVVVDSYGDVIGETTAPVSAEAWDALAANVGDIEQLSIEEDDGGCTGGTSRSITIIEADETILDRSFSVCQINEEAADQLDAYVEPVIDEIPNWNSLFE